MQKPIISFAVATSVILFSQQASAALINTYSGPGPAYTSNITTTRSSNCCGGVTESVNLVNGLGFTGGTPPNFTDSDFDGVPEHYDWTTLSNGGWLSNGNPAADEWVSFDLGATFYVEKMRVWNWDQSNAVNRSTATANVWYSTAVSPGLPGGAATNPALSGWTQLGTGPFSFQNPVGPSFDTIDDILFNAPGYGIDVRHILIDIVSSHGDQYVGLGEVQFFDTPVPTPEPSTLALIGLGAIGLAIKTRRRRAAA